MNSKPFFVVFVFLISIAIFASGLIGNTDLTDAGTSQDFGTSSNDTAGSTDINYDVFGGGAPSAAEGVAGATAPKAASSNSSVKNSPCGSVYTVKSGDTLTRIAQNCGVTLKDILAENPAIKNPDVIQVGQKITLYQAAPTPVPVVEAAEIQQPVEVAATATRIPGIKPGSMVPIEIKGLPPNMDIRVGIGRQGRASKEIGTSRTDDEGVFRSLVAVPTTAKPNERWWVTVIGIKRPNIKMTSEPFTIGQ